jgi:hypothetical protein
MGVSLRLLYGAIRKASSESPFPEWLDTSTIKFSKWDSKVEAEKTDAKIPEWAALHPVLRIAELRIEEIDV